MIMDGNSYKFEQLCEDDDDDDDENFEGTLFCLLRIIYRYCDGLHHVIILVHMYFHEVGVWADVCAV